jgi:hypothetical protein
MARRDPTRTDKIGIAISFVILFGIMAGQIGGLTTIHQGRESKKWPDVDGTVERWHVKRHTSKSNSGNRTTRYHVRVAYRYKVRGQTLRARRYSVEAKQWHSAQSRAAAKRWARSNASPGKRIRVYYDPKQPQDAVVHTGTSAGPYVILFFTALFSGGFWILLQKARPESKQQRDGAMYLTAALISTALVVMDLVALSIV